jgi:hypothetical protein
MKVCNNCPFILDCWEKFWKADSNYCYRDRESIVIERDDDVKITKMYEVATGNNIATGEEIATVVANIRGGLKLRELKAKNDRIYFVFSEDEKEGCERE